jgi:phage terminase large subunit-like protein
MKMGYRSKDSYRGKTPEARERQLAGLKNASRSGRPPITDPLLKGEGSDPFSQIYKNDIIGFLERFYFIPETKRPVQLELWQRERIFKPLLQVDENGLRKCTLALIGLPKKNSKSSMAAMLGCYFLFQDEDYGEILLAANSREQSSWIIFSKLTRAILMNPQLSQHIKVTDDYLENKKTGSIARVVAPNFKTSAGFNASLVLFDELWAYERDAARKFYDEMTTSPARKQPLTVIFSYAGHSEDCLLHEIYMKGLKGEDAKMFFLWSHENLASWISPSYLQTQRQRLRGNTYLRLHENRWTESEEQFIEAEDWDACVHSDHHPLLPDKNLVIAVGVDASVKHDSSAVVATTKRDNQILLVQHRIWTPSQRNPMDFEISIEAYIKELAEHYTVKECRFDPYQMHRSALTLGKAGIKMVEFPQSTDRLTSMGQNLYNLIKGRNLLLYEDKTMRDHALRCVAQESQRGWKITKSQGSHRIDSLIALAISAFAAVDMKTRKRDWIYVDKTDDEIEQAEQAELAELENDQGWEEVKNLAFH